MSAETVTLEFQAEVRELLRIMIHSLYSHREIFLRELISNASDALDKLRFAALTNSELVGLDHRPHVRLEVDRQVTRGSAPHPGARILRVIDNGIGMSREEVVSNIGTIARSGTRRFLEEARGREAQGELPRLIGQFGVGFYSSFMVADEVVLETRKAGEEGGTRWRSRGDGEYTVEDCERAGHGTTVSLHLKPVDDEAEGEFRDFAEEWALRQVVKRYSDFVEYPIEMDVERSEGEGKDAKKVVKTEVQNSMKPLWTRRKSEITEEEHAEFYRHITHDWEAPLETIHFRGEGAHAYTALLYLPKRRPFDMFDPSASKSHISLYIRRVHVAPDCEELMPTWLRFVRGLVDSDDLPLNISRETLQHSRQVGQIRKRLVRKVLDTLERRLAKDRASYAELWGAFGAVLKEGIYQDDELKADVAKVCLFHGTAGDEPCTLDEYVERMPAGQAAIYYLAGSERKTLSASPHLEAFRAKGYAVLFLTDTVDEFAFERLREYREKPLKSIERGEVELESEDEKKAREEKQQEHATLLEAVKDELEEFVDEVRFSPRLKSSPVVLVSGEHGMSRAQERLLRELHQQVPAAKRILELNPAHPMVERLTQMRGAESGDRFGEYCELLYGQALLAEGSPLPDPARFSALLTGLMVGTTG